MSATQPGTRATAAASAAASGSVRNVRSAAASARGSSCGTTIPEPSASSSAACGNAVATTGFAEAIASTSTPETTWLRERYGSRTMSALRISARISARPAVAAVELDQVVDAALDRERLQRLAVGLAGVADDVRVRLAQDDVTGRRVEVAQLREGLDRVLDPLARPEQPPREDDRPPARLRGRRARRRCWRARRAGSP